MALAVKDRPKFPEYDSRFTKRTVFFMKKQPALPSCASVFGTSTFPAIDNQGGIGSCASQSITRNQFTNAYARYIQSIEEGSAYCPRDNGALPFTPKFTFNFSGAGTVWVYDILKEQGCLRQADAPFHKNEDGGSVIKDKDGNLYTDTSSWCVKEGEMERALSARIRNFKQVWFTKEPYSEKLTTSEAGQKLIVSIKEAIVRGDAVVTGGYPARWVFGQLDGCGTLGGVGEAAVVAAAGNAGGGHQVTLVGYDDNVTATFGGVRLKGAFQIANSYGAGWQNKGLTWLMYDAVNTVSAYPELNNSALYSGPMYLTPSQNMSMFPSSLAQENQELGFEEEGTFEIYGKSYPAFYIKDGAKYLSYKKEKGERGLFLSEEKSVRFAFIPYGDMLTFETSDKQYAKEEFNGSYWVYGVDKEDTPEGMRVLDAGVGYSSSGRKVNFATHNAARYPEAKSWELEKAPKGNFTSRLSIAAGKGQASERGWALDQFCFLDWTKDVVLGMPELYVKATVTATDRECFRILLTRKEKGGSLTKKFTPAIFRYSQFHPTYCDRKKGEYVNFEGKLKGGECTGYFAFSYEPLLKLPKGKTMNDYEWGIEFKKGRKGKAALVDATLCNSDKETLATAKAENGKITFVLN